MKILFISHTVQKYGASRSLLALIDGLSARGVSSYVITRKMGPLGSELASRGVVHDVIPFKLWATTRSNRLKRLMRTYSHTVVASFIARKAQSWGIDVIHTNSSVTPVGALAAQKANIPHIWHIREYGEEDYGLTYDYGFKKSAQLMADLSYRLVIISETLARKYRPYVAPRKIEVVYNPVSVNPLADKVSNQKDYSIPQVVMIGLLHPAKGIEDAILAVAELVQRGRPINLNLVGDGSPSYSNFLKQLVFQHNVESHVNFLGYIDDPSPILQTADVLLVCSRSEAFGRVTVEGMLHKKPVVAARAGASVELIEENVNGLFYETGNPTQLADAIAYLLKNPEKAQKMGENGFRFASKTFSVEKHVNTMYNIFSESRNADILPAKKKPFQQPFHDEVEW